MSADIKPGCGSPGCFDHPAATPTPLDPSKVKAEAADRLAAEVAEFLTTSIAKANPNLPIVRKMRTALADYQPAPEPEPEWKPGTVGTAEVVREGANGGPRLFRRTRGMVVHRPAPIDDDMFVTVEGDLWALEGDYCKNFVPDEPRPLPDLTPEHLAYAYDRVVADGGDLRSVTVMRKVLARLRGESR